MQRHVLLAGSALALAISGCGGGDGEIDPTEVEFGSTTFLFVV